MVVSVSVGHRRCPWRPGLEQFGDAEVQQLDGAFLGHQDVLRLEVAMDHQVLVRVMHRGADREEETQRVSESVSRWASQYWSIGVPAMKSITK